MFKQRIPLKVALFFVAVGAILAFAVGTILAPTAKATPASYLSTLEANGYTGPMWKWLNLGDFICDMSGYMSDSAIAEHVFSVTGSGVGYSQAHQIMDIARIHLCPNGNWQFVEPQESGDFVV